jgi:hypothetical protein
MMSLVVMGSVMPLPWLSKMARPGVLLGGLLALTLANLTTLTWLANKPGGLGNTLSRFSPQHRLEPGAHQLIEHIARTLKPADVLVMDFMSWSERTVALRATQRGQALFFLPGAPGEKFDEAGFNAALCTSGHGLMVLNQNSPLLKTHVIGEGVHDWAGVTLDFRQATVSGEFVLYGFQPGKPCTH